MRSRARSVAVHALRRRLRVTVGLAVLFAAGAVAAQTAAASPPALASTTSPGDVTGAAQLHTIFSGVTVGATQPDDITTSGGRLFVAFQNGVGPQGQPSTTGARASKVVEITADGSVVRWWSITGHVDGLTADPTTGQVVATVNEDANSSLFLIDPANGATVHYAYSVNPLPHNGGTDAVSFWQGEMVVSASAPGTLGGTQAAAPNGSYPAAYRVILNPATHVAQVSPLFFDEDTATVANAGAGNASSVSLALTDPDSSTVVPTTSSRFAGDLALDSQGDKEVVFVGGGTLSVLKLSQSIDDLRWPTAATGTLYITDSSADIVDVLNRHFTPSSPVVAVSPCDAGNAPADCPRPGFPPNYLGTINLQTGTVSPFELGGLEVQPGGLAFGAGATARRRRPPSLPPRSRPPAPRRPAVAFSVVPRPAALPCRRETR